MDKRTIFRMLDEAATRYADKNYLCEKGNQGWNRTSFKEVKNKAIQLAAAFIELGVEYQDKVAILSEAKNDWIIAEFATLYSGGISVPLSIKLLPEEIPFRVNHSDSKIFIISENTLEKVIPYMSHYHNKDLKLVVLDKPSAKISQQCKRYNFDEEDLLFIEDLYNLGLENIQKNKPKIKKIVSGIHEDDIVTISYTSGTTGNPKGIMLTHLNYYSNSNEAVRTFQIKEFISTLIILPTDHSFAHTVGIYTSLVKGLSIHFVDARGGGMNALKNIPKNLIEASPNFLLTVPALTSNFINKFKEGIRSKGSFIEGIFNRGLDAAYLRNGDGYRRPGFFVQIKTFFNYWIAKVLIFNKLKYIFGKNIEFLVGGGALLDIKQQQFYKAIGVPVYQGYGLTEATPIISTNTPFEHKMGTSGKVLGNIECKICNDEGSSVPQGMKGEIVIRGDNVMKGYYKNPESTQEVLKNGWLYTGDIGFFDDDEFLVVVGREKALLISEDGEKYSPEEIEEAIVNGSSFIHQVMIYNDHKKYTTALLTLNVNVANRWVNDHKIDSLEVLLDHIKMEMLIFEKQLEFTGKFPKKWIPSQFQIIEEEFTEANKMINSTLKMVRHRITETYQDKLDKMYLSNAQNLIKEENIKTLSRSIKLVN